jgi:predicted ATPase
VATPVHIRSVTLDIERYPTGDHYPFNLPVFRSRSSIAFTRPVTFFIGENGTGKTTLLKAMALQSGVHIWQDTDRRRYVRNPYENKFHNYLRVDWTDRRVPGVYFGSNYFQFFSEILDEWAVSDPGQLKYFGGHSLVSLSHGQSILAYFRKVFQIEGVFFLDEPETALSPASQIQLLNLVKAFAGERAQFFIATHSPILLACPGATIYCFDGEQVGETTYEQTEYFRLYKQFMNNPDSFLDGEETVER